jgi:hypothetical protein
LKNWDGESEGHDPLNAADLLFYASGVVLAIAVVVLLLRAGVFFVHVSRHLF